MSSSGSVRAGEVIAGKFQVERVLGEGGMGYVVAARHLQLGQMVALKFIKEDVCTPEFKARFLREARNTVKLKSKHVSRVLDVGALDGGSPYMVMEYLEGTDLSELLQRRGPFPPQEAADYIIQACEAIAEAHGHGIVHRDLKPANLFLTRGTGGEAVVKVLDFGVSKVLDLDDDTSAGGHHDSVVTKATDLLGSPSYMAPEQVVSARDADSRSDVWSMGVILFRLVSGKAPFAGNSLGDLIQKIVHGPLPNLRDVRPDIPEGLEHVVWRCFERDREKRPDAVELARMLSAYAGPNAAPSLERIAILGPALIRAPLAPSVPPASGSYSGQSGPKANWTSGPPMPAMVPIESRPPKKDMSSASFFVWVLLSFIVVGSLAFVGRKLMKMPSLGGDPKPTPTFSPLPPPSAEPSAVAQPPPSPSPVPIPSPAPVSIPSARPSASVGHAPTTKPPITPRQPTVRPPAPAPAPAPAPPPPPPPAPASEIPGTREN
ncbi:MAG: serine/threonine protein kinase [Labilithrix sp.]|nr:serine/threonine protein kinase [Labilithrix sp.]MCW5809565.1 serine/threonine protein kinase [Labilithrix sp.]